MFTIIIQEKGGESRRMVFNKPEVTIGRVQGNDIVLPKGNVSKRHARIVLKDGKFIIVDLKSTNGTYVNGRKITSPLVVKDADKIYIGDFIVGVDEAASGDGDGPSETTTSPPGDRLIAPPAEARPPRPTEAAPMPMPMPQTPYMPPPPPEPPEPAPPPPRAEPKPAAPAPAPAMRPGPPRPAPSPTRQPPMPSGDPDVRPAMPPIASPPPGGRPMGRPGGTMPPPMAQPMSPIPSPAMAAPAPPPMPMAPEPAPFVPPAPAPAPAPVQHAGSNGAAAPVVPIASEKKKVLQGAAVKKVPGRVVASAPSRRGVHLDPLDPKVVKMLDLQSTILERLRAKLDLDKIPMDRLHEEDLWQKAERATIDLVETLETSGELPKYVDQDTLIKETLNEALALGPLEDLFADEKIDENIIDRRDRVVVGKDGLLRGSGKAFSSDDVFERVVKRLVAEAGAVIDEARPLVDLRMRDGTRLTAAVSPVAARGACLVLKKAPSAMPPLSDLVGQNSLSSGMADFLATCIAARRNLLVCSAPGSGKTTMAAALAAAAPAGERVVSIEEVAEMAIARDEWVQLAETRPSLGKGPEVDMNALLDTAMRLGADRLVVGEVRGREAMALVSALCSSVDGAVVAMTGEGAQSVLSIGSRRSCSRRPSRAARHGDPRAVRGRVRDRHLRHPPVGRLAAGVVDRGDQRRVERGVRDPRVVPAQGRRVRGDRDGAALLRRPRSQRNPSRPGGFSLSAGADPRGLLSDEWRDSSSTSRSRGHTCAQKLD